MIPANRLTDSAPAPTPTPKPKPKPPTRGVRRRVSRAQRLHSLMVRWGELLADFDALESDTPDNFLHDAREYAEITDPGQMRDAIAYIMSRVAEDYARAVTQIRPRDRPALALAD